MSDRAIYITLTVALGLAGIFVGRGIRRFTGGARGPALVVLFVGVVLFFGGLAAAQHIRPYFVLAAVGLCLQVAAVISGRRRSVPLRASTDLWQDTRRPWE